MNLKKIFIVISIILVFIVLFLKSINFYTRDVTTDRAAVEHFGNCARDKSGRLITYPAELSLNTESRHKILCLIAKIFLPGNWEELSIKEQKLFLEKAECPVFRESTRPANIIEQ